MKKHPALSIAVPLKSMPSADQPRERLLLLGASRLSTVELLSILIASGNPGRSAPLIAAEFLAKFGNLREAGRLTAQETMNLAGIGPAKACRIQAAIELGRRCVGETLLPGMAIKSSLDVYEAFRLECRDLKRETFWSILLDGQNRMIRGVQVSIGTLTTSVVHPREVFNAAIREFAASVILLHNHPSGDPTPSQMDFEVTQRLIRAGELVGIKVLDHVIVGEDRYVSLKEDTTLFA